MKDIYQSMSSQNILNYYGSKLDIKVDNSENYNHKQEENHKVDLIVDNSELYDFILDTSDYVDLIVDNSENYDVQLDNSLEIDIPIIYEKIINVKPSICDYTVLTNDDFLISTQNGECIQYEH